MTLLTRNEADILRDHLDFHLAQGVHHIIVTDNCSSDATPDILADYVARGVVTSIYEPSDTYDQDLWVTRMARMAADMGARWVINSDTDEFWLPQDAPDLASYFGRWRLANIISVERHDFVCTGDPAEPFWQRMIYRRAVSTGALGIPLQGKVAHRGSAKIQVRQGNHRVRGLFWPRIQASQLEILHFPLRARTQYLDKIRTGGLAYSKNERLGPGTGRDWRAEYAELLATGTTAFCDANVYDGARINAALASEEIFVDRRLHDIMVKLPDRSITTL